jgi:hypothetical protein
MFTLETKRQIKHRLILDRLLHNPLESKPLDGGRSSTMRLLSNRSHPQPLLFLRLLFWGLYGDRLVCGGLVGGWVVGGFVCLLVVVGTSVVCGGFAR